MQMAGRSSAGDHSDHARLSDMGPVGMAVTAFLFRVHLDRCESWPARYLCKTLCANSKHYGITLNS
jgi:hypothetical protein